VMRSRNCYKVNTNENEKTFLRINLNFVPIVLYKIRKIVIYINKVII